MSCRQRALSFLCSLALPIFVLASTIVLGTPFPCEAAEPKRVILLHSFGPLFKPWSDTAQTFRSEIARQARTAVDFRTTRW